MDRPQEYRIYKPNKNGNGVASKWQLSFKPEKKYDQFELFLVTSSQSGEDEKGNQRFDWESGIIVKIGEADLGEIISVLEGRKDSLGFKGMLFHETPGGGNKVIKLDSTEKGYTLSVSAQDSEKNKKNHYQVISPGEAAILLVLLRAAVVRIYNW